MLVNSFSLSLRNPVPRDSNRVVFVNENLHEFPNVFLSSQACYDPVMVYFMQAPMNIKK